MKELNQPHKVFQSKSQLRKAILQYAKYNQKKNSITDKNQNNAIINFNHLKSLIDEIIDSSKYTNDTNDGICIALYAPIHQEVNLLTLIDSYNESQKKQSLKQPSINWCLPEVVKEEFPLLFRQFNPVSNYSDKLLKTASQNWKCQDAFGINIPLYANYVVPDIMIIPCVATQVYDNKFYRLGYGKGFYDRTLLHYQSAISIGVTPIHYEKSAWDSDSFDQPLDFIFQF
jgi:5,10-methenyltetrahydrofolate synthetase